MAALPCAKGQTGFVDISEDKYDGLAKNSKPRLEGRRKQQLASRGPSAEGLLAISTVVTISTNVGHVHHFGYAKVDIPEK
jgi:hypothetical protein